MHLLSAGCVCALTVLALLHQVAGMDTVTGLYGDTLEIPCNNGVIKAEDILIIKWKYDKEDKQSGDLVVQQSNQNVSIFATDEYKDRVSFAANFSLLISGTTLTDQRIFTCMVVASTNIMEYPVNVVIYKMPRGLVISDKAEELEIGKLTKLGTCVAKDANPASNITWLKNNKPLVTDGKRISIQTTVEVDPVTSLSTTNSTLEYSAEKEDKDAQFTCSTRHPGGAELTSTPMTLTITYSTESIDLQVIPQEALVEGDNVTLKCVADGSPAPTSFNFHLKGEMVKVENADTYTITNISRETTGEYKCSLPDDASMEASKIVTVNYLDIDFSPTGSIVKPAGDVLIPTLKIDSSGETKSTWTKDGVKLDEEPNLTKLAYSQSGVYECEVTMGFLIQKASFELVVKGAPVIKQLSQQLSEDGLHKVLICEAEGFPKPAVSWSINGTLLEESPYVNGQIIHKIKVVPSENLTVSCVMTNDFGADAKVINVSSLNWKVRVDKQDSSNDSDQTKLVVGVVVGLLVATAVIGLAYWVYTKKSKQGSWKTGEKECGSSEEEKKLEEKVEENSQKAEV